MSRRQHLDIQRAVLAVFLLSGPRQAVSAVKVRLYDIEPTLVEGAMVELVVAGILEHEGQTMRLRECVDRLIELDMLGSIAPVPVASSCDQMTRFVVRRVTYHTGPCGEVVGHVEVPEPTLMRARSAAIKGGLVRDSDAFIIYPETRDAQRAREGDKTTPPGWASFAYDQHLDSIQDEKIISPHRN